MVTLADWMQDCKACTDLASALDTALKDDTFPLKEASEVQDHLVASHLSKVPDYDETCPNCQEWRILAVDPGGIQPALVPVLGREDLLHRAGHLIFPWMR